MQDPGKVFAAAGNPQRLSILQLLGEDGLVVYSDIMKKMGIVSGSLGFHLKELLESGLVEKKNGDKYALSDLGVSLMSWCGKADQNEEARRHLREKMEWRNIRDPLRPYRQHPGRGLFRFGIILVMIGVLAVAGGQDALMVGILLACGTASAVAGSFFEYLAGRAALQMSRPQQARKAP